MILKNTFVQGKMNKDVDERLIPNGQYIHAENIRVANTDSSDIGAIENVRGNEILTNLSLTNGRTIGAYEDGSNQKLYFFVTSDTKDLVVEYDKGNSQTNILLESSKPNSVLNFSTDYLITGVVKVINEDFNRDLLLWTDDLNPPRKINIERSKTYTIDGFTEDDISLIKKPPRFAPEIFPTFSAEEDENNLDNKFLSFSYRYKYLDGEYSALSSFTNYNFNPTTFDLDYQTLENDGMVNFNNAVDIRFNTGTSNVTDIQLFFKESNSNNIYLIETFNKENKGYADNVEVGYVFSNSKVYRVLPDDELFRQYDNVPRKAKSLELIGNRLVFGNYVEGYDMKDYLGQNVNIDLNVSAINNLISNINVNYTLEPNISLVDFAHINIDLTGIELKKGYRLDFALRLNESVISRFRYNTVQDLRNETDTPQVYPQPPDRFNEVVYVNSTNKYYEWQPNNFPPPDDGINIIDQTNTPNTGAGAGRWVNILYTDTSVNFDNVFNYILKRDFVDANDLASEPEFVSFVNDFMTNRFYFLLVGSPPDHSNTTANFTGFSIVSSTSTNIIINSPTREYEIDDTPLVGGDPANTRLVTSNFIYSLSSSITYSKNDAIKSLKTNRSYEVGVVYYDDYNRASTVLTNDENTVYIPQAFSTYQNRLQIEIYNKPPYWADRYKIVVKQNKNSDYNIIYTSVFYEEDLFRWVKLEGDNKDKVREGDILIVKADSGGVLDDLVKTKVIEVTTKEKDFLSSGSQESGLYMKIKPFGFGLNADSLNIRNFVGGSHLRYPARTFTSPRFGDGSGVSYTPYPLLAGSRVRIYIKISAKGSISFTDLFDNTYVVQSDYGDVQEWFNAEVATTDTWLDFASTKTWDGVTNIGDNVSPLPSGSFDPATREGSGWGFVDDTINRNNQNVASGGRQFFVVARRKGTASRKIGTDVKFEISFSDGSPIFETEASDSTDNVFYETQQTFEIINNNHQGTDSQHQDILTNTPAIIDLDFFNCFVQGNGAESYRYKDAFNIGTDLDGNQKAANYLNLDLRPTATSIEKFREVRRYADLTYSEPYNENTNVNGLNEFNLSKANYKEDIDKKYGYIQKLHSRDTDLIVFQEDKVSKVLFGKDLLLNADGTSNVASIEDVLGQQVAYTGEYGISNNPESFAFDGYHIYFTDAKRGAVMRLSNNGLTEISENGMNQYFKDLFRNSLNGKKFGGIDPYNDQYFLHSLDDQITISYDESVGGFTSFHSFQPDFMIGMNNEFYSFKNGDLYIHHSDNVNRNVYYGVSYPSKISIVVNEAPSDIKLLNAISLEGNYAWDMVIKSYVSNVDDFIQSSINQLEFVKKEGIWYAYARRNEEVLHEDSKSIYGIGTITNIVGNDITVNGYNSTLTIGNTLLKGTDFGVSSVITNVVRVGNITTITVSSVVGFSINDFVVGLKDARIEGGNLRGYTFRQDLEISKTNKVELFAVNSKVVKSFGY